MALVAAGAVVLPIAIWRWALPGLWSATAAWGTCFFSGLLALWTVHLFNDPKQVVQQVLSGILIRTSLPLAACLTVQVLGGTLADAGFLYYILAFYVVTLAVETVLVVGVLSEQPIESQSG